MLIGLSALEETDWSRLLHAYGRAVDTPGHLRAFLEFDADARAAAMSHLWAAILHQGSAYTATPAVALVLVGLLADERIDQGEPGRAHVLSFLGYVAQVFDYADLDVDSLKRLAAFDVEAYLDAYDDDESDNEEASSALYARTILGCYEARPVIMQVMLDALGHSRSEVRVEAAWGASILANDPSLKNTKHDIETQLWALIETAPTIDERCALVLALGELGIRPVQFLNESSPALRMCAALSPELAENEAALEELATTLRLHASEIDTWFSERPPQFEMSPRFSIIERLAKNVKDFGQIVDAAVAVAQVATKHTVDYDWGPLLAMAFADGSGSPSSEPQRRYLEALVDREELWDPVYANPRRWFKKAGLPYDRQACFDLLMSV
ncbi:MAG: hypothetical protein ABIY70_09335 [Capsulimonas sp.]|uniref:hypothetical protein n=1 Tax=Capsulimonas sp. TaxID=2494211 RepID=UPI0032659FAF